MDPLRHLSPKLVQKSTGQMQRMNSKRRRRGSSHDVRTVVNTPGKFRNHLEICFCRINRRFQVQVSCRHWFAFTRWFFFLNLLVNLCVDQAPCRASLQVNNIYCSGNVLSLVAFCYSCFAFPSRSSANWLPPTFYASPHKSRYIDSFFL